MARILVIDDDPDVLDTTRLFLENRGFEVVTASDPDEGMRQAKDSKPDVIVLDVMMPHGTEGFHWLWKIRRHPDQELREKPIILVTSISGATGIHFKAGDADETGCYLPVQAFLDKPLDPDELAKAIGAVLDQAV